MDAELTVVRRQKDQRDIEDFKLVREGKADVALRNPDARGRVHVSEDSSHRMAEVMADYREHREAGWQARDIRIIADTSNHDIDTANRFVQRDRLARGELRPGGIEVHEAETDRRWTIHEGDQVIMLGGYRNESEDPVRNGTTGTVLSVDNRANIAGTRFEGDRIVKVGLETEAQRQPVGIAYAQHAQKAQGGEVAIVQVMPGRGQTNANTGCSMMTRGINESHVYVSKVVHGPEPVKALGEAWQKRDERGHLRLRARREPPGS